MSFEALDLAFHPRAIAVVGASGNPLSLGLNFVRHLVNYGFEGPVYPVTPNWNEIAGLQTYPSLLDISGPVDLVICCLAAAKVPDLLRQCPDKGVRVVHLFTGRLSETGQGEPAELEAEILRLARERGLRLIGPNCMGVYNPRKKIGFGYEFPMEPGDVGMFMQSGGAAGEFVYYAAQRGMRFSKVLSYGNALDINESDILEYLAADEETKIIGAYVEGLQDGRRFMNTVRKTTPHKPVIILKVGRGRAGAGSAASHTAALAGSPEMWTAALKQAGAVEAHTLEDLVDVIVAFSLLPPITSTRVGVTGGGGGKSVLSAGEWEEGGFDVAPLPTEIGDWIRKTMPELWWGWLRNPVDLSIVPFGPQMMGVGEEMIKMMAQSKGFDLVAVNVTIGGPLSGKQLTRFIPDQVNHIIRVKQTSPNPIVVVLNSGAPSVKDLDQDRWRSLAEALTPLTEAGIPVYGSPSLAAGAVIRLIRYYQWKSIAVPTDHSS